MRGKSTAALEEDDDEDEVPPTQPEPVVDPGAKPASYVEPDSDGEDFPISQDCFSN